jgi:arylsulfatase A-like enzyme
LADDLGWRDLGCYGSSFYETPNIDRLATESVRFTDAYASAPVCSPTRASVISGQYPARVGVTNFISWVGAHPDRARLVDAPYDDHLDFEGDSIAEAFADAGYDTWHVGKWHLGGAEQDSLPTDHGFDVNVGGSDRGLPTNGYFSPYEMPNLEDGPEGEYLTDRLTGEAIDLIDEHGHGGGGRADGADNPFFLNLCFYAPHTPIQAKADTVAKYERKRQRLGLDEVQEFEEGEELPADRHDHRVQRRLVQSDPEYAAMIQHLDHNVGRLLEALEDRGLAEDTVVVFTSDNGGESSVGGSPTCNDPLAEGKGWMYEGGNRVPLLVRWPGMTDDAADMPCDVPVTTPDLYPTILDAAGRDPPAAQPVDGETLRPLLAAPEDAALDREAIFWHYPHYGNQGGTPSAAVRSGRWKLIEHYEDGSTELYDLNADVSERQDLSSSEWRKALELEERLAEWREDVGAIMPEQNTAIHDEA